MQGIEDALTMLIMADKQVSRDVFSAIYLPGGWDDFARLSEAWRSMKATS